MILKSFEALDFIILALSLGLTFAAVIYGNTLRPKEESESFLDLILMGRKLTTPMFVATLVATWYGGIFGTAQIAFESGLYNFLTQGAFWYVAYLLFAFFIVSRIDLSKHLTLADLVGDLFGPKARSLTAVFNILNLIPVAYTISLAYIMQMIFHCSFTQGALAGMSLVMLYSLFGGFRAVVFSDMVQFSIMMSAVVLVAALSLSTYGLAPLYDLPKDHLSLSGGHGFWETLSWGLIAVSTLVDPNFYQRAYAAKNKKVVKKGILISIAFWILFDLSLTLGAMYAAALYPDSASNEGYFLYAIALLPVGLKGFFFSGILATVLSTLDSYLFLSGTTFAVDWVKKHEKRFYYSGVLFAAAMSLLLAFAFEGNIKAVWKALGSISSSALLLPVMAGLIWRGFMSDKQFVIVASTSALGTVLWRLTGAKAHYGVDELYPGVGVSVLLMLTIHFSNKKLDEAPR